jgi:hypothetical protein
VKEGPTAEDLCGREPKDGGGGGGSTKSWRRWWIHEENMRKGAGSVVASIRGATVWFAVGRRGHKQDGRSGEKAGLMLLVARVSICEEQGSADVRHGREASRLTPLLFIFVEKRHQTGLRLTTCFAGLVMVHSTRAI